MISTAHLTLSICLLVFVAYAVAQTSNSTNDTAFASNYSAAQHYADVPSATSLTTSRVDQVIPPFSGLRSCLPFNILLAAPDPSTSSPNAASNGRILIDADYNVINATLARVEDGILTLSIPNGFETQQPINFTVVMPINVQLRYVANYGSGLLVLGPGHTTSRLRLLAQNIGQIKALNVTANSLSFAGSGVLGSTVAGAFSRINVNTTTATGSIAVRSYTPAVLQADLAGITTLLADLPAGSTINGTAGGLSKVQYTQGSCSVASDTPLQFAAPSIFGADGFSFSLPILRGAPNFAGSIFGSKCQQVAQAALQSTIQNADSPEWSCGIVVDGQLSCQGDAASALSVTPITWQVSNITTYQPVAVNASNTPSVTTQSPTPSPPAGQTPSPSPSQDESSSSSTSLPQSMSPSPSPTQSASSSSDSGSPSPPPSAWSSSSPSPSPYSPSSPSPSPASELDSSQQNSTINDTGDQAPAVTSISGSGDAATADEAQTAAVAVEPSVTGIGEQAAANAGNTNLGRKLLQSPLTVSSPSTNPADEPTSSPSPSPSSNSPSDSSNGSSDEGSQSSPSPSPSPGSPSSSPSPSPSSPATSSTPAASPPGGTLTTGAATSGPGSQASGSSSISSPRGWSSQTTSSQGGSPPQTSLSTGGVGSSIFNPLFVPSTPADAFQGASANTAAAVAEANTSGSTAAPVTPQPVHQVIISPPAANGSTTRSSVAVASSSSAPAVAVSMANRGPGSTSGVAVANTVCKSNTSLNMLL